MYVFLQSLLKTLFCFTDQPRKSNKSATRSTWKLKTKKCSHLFCLKGRRSAAYGPCLGTQVKFHLPSGSFLTKACPWGKLWVLTLLDGLSDILNAKSVRLRGVRGVAGGRGPTDGLIVLQSGVQSRFMTGLQDEVGEMRTLSPGGLSWILSCGGVQ